MRLLDINSCEIYDLDHMHFDSESSVSIDLMRNDLEFRNVRRYYNLENTLYTGHSSSIFTFFFD